LKGNCASEVTQFKLVLENDCMSVAEYSGPEACKVYGLDFDYYQKLIYPFIGIIFIFVGLGLVFFGNRLLFWIFGSIVLSFVSLGSFLFCYNLFISSSTS